MIKDELLKQEFYINAQKRLVENSDKLSSLGYSSITNDVIKTLSLNAKNLDLSTNDDTACKIILDTLKSNIALNNKVIKYLNNYKNPTDDDKEYIEIQTELLEEHNYTLESQYKALHKNYSQYVDELTDVSGSLDNILNENDYSFEESIKDSIFENSEGQMTIGDTFGNMSFENLISNAKNSALESWYKFLQDLHESPIKSFVLNKNTICNFKLIFKNPYTGLTTDKESVVHLSHSTSSKKTPVFSIGSVSYKATSTGVKLLAGSLVTAALDNVPLPYLHAISYMNHSSVEDLPPLDLYIIPIENISEEGRYEVLCIKGIQFVDMKQSDNASSTGIYYAFNYFAQDIVPLDFSESEKYFKIQYEGNNNL